MYIKRSIEKQILSDLGRGKALIIYGARQVGKTTLLRRLKPNFVGQALQGILYLSCDERRVREQLVPDALALKNLFGTHKIIVLDEAQFLDDPGLVMKIIVDQIPEVTVLATGSSSFTLANKLGEPLTGRHFKYQLFPFLYSEIKNSVPAIDMQFQVEQAMIFGTYPEVFVAEGRDDKIRRLQTLTDAYLYRDILSFNLVKNSSKVTDLLVQLALSLGNELSYLELGNKLGLDRKTIERYVDLLEQAFVIFRLRPFTGEGGGVISRKVKIYFYDCGVRNALLNNFNELKLRSDSEQLFESYVIAEMMKKHANDSQKPNFYFWRTYGGREMDLVEVRGDKIIGYDIEYAEPKLAKPKTMMLSEIDPRAEVKKIGAGNVGEVVV